MTVTHARTNVPQAISGGSAGSGGAQTPAVVVHPRATTGGGPRKSARRGCPRGRAGRDLNAQT